MQRFLCDAHRGAAVLSAYRTKGFQRDRSVDFFSTVEGVSSGTYLVSPGAPSDRERMVLSWPEPDDCIHEYANRVLTADAPYFCLANNPSLHAFVMQKLQSAGLHDPSRFSVSPVEGAGELVAFRYTGGRPRHVVFPVGSDPLNWLTVVRSSTEMGLVLASHEGADAVLRDGEGRSDARALRRARVWRALDFVEECCQRAGMLHYNPLSAGTVRFGAEAERTHVKTGHDHNLLFLGDSFSKESVLFADVAAGGPASDFWAALSAVVRFKGLDARGAGRAAEVDRSSAAKEDESSWRRVLRQGTDDRGYRRFPGPAGTGEDVLLKAVEAHVADGKRESVLGFVRNVLTRVQRNALGNLSNSAASRAALADAVLYAPARILTWTLLYSLLSSVKFNVLHVLGYEAHRKLVFKLFVPALIAVFLKDSCITDTFAHGALNLQLLREKAGGQTLANVLDRRPAVVRDGRAASATAPPRNYCQFDPASLSGELNAFASIPFAVNMDAAANAVSEQLKLMEVVVSRTIQLFDAKSKAAADNRRMRRSALAALSRRRKRGREDPDPAPAAADGEDEDARERDDGSGDCRIIGYVPKRRVPYVTVDNEQRETTLRAIQEKMTARYNRRCARARNGVGGEEGGGGEGGEGGAEEEEKGEENGLVSDVALADASVKAILNILEDAFRLRRGTVLNSVHLNERTGEGVYKSSSRQTSADAMVRDADDSERKVSAADPPNPGRMADRFFELYMDPPTVHDLRDFRVAERVLQNELLVTTLPHNPVFASLYRAEGPLDRVVVLTNIVKYMNAATVCLVDGDLPTLVDTRKGVKRAVTKGQKADFDYRKAGSAPVGMLRSQLLPRCLSNLKSISARAEGGSTNQTCRHSFCRALRFLFYSLEPESAHASLVDDASRVSLLALAEFCSRPACDGGWHAGLIDPVIHGTDAWTASGRYSPLPSEGDPDGRGPRDAFYTIRSILVDQDLLADEQEVDHWKEMLLLKAEGHRRECFGRSRSGLFFL